MTVQHKYKKSFFVFLFLQKLCEAVHSHPTFLFVDIVFLCLYFSIFISWETHFFTVLMTINILNSEFGNSNWWSEIIFVSYFEGEGVQMSKGRFEEGQN